MIKLLLNKCLISNLFIFKKKVIMGSRNIRMSIFSRIHRIRPRKTKYPTYKNLTVTTTRVIILNFQCVLRSNVLSSVCKTYLFNKDNKRLHFYLSIFKLCIVLYSSSSNVLRLNFLYFFCNF